MTMPDAAEFDPDILVIDAVRAGHRDAFEDLVRTHDRWVRGVILGVLGNRDVVDDVAQQVWSSVWYRIRELRDTRRWRPWLYRLTRNAAIDARRDRTRRRAVGIPIAGDLTPEAPSPTPPQQLSNAEQQAAIMQAIQSLPALYREPFVLRHLQDWSYRQIAQTMGIPVDTVETRLVRARRRLRKALATKV